MFTSVLSTLCSVAKSLKILDPVTAFSNRIVNSMHSARLSIALFAAGVVSVSGCTMTLTNGYRFDFQGEKEARQMDIEIPATATSLDLRNLHGDVEILPAADGVAALKWELTCWADSQAEAGRQIERVQLVTSEEGGIFKCEVKLPTEEKELLRGVKSNMKLRVPASLIVSVRNSHGNIVAAELDCPVELQGAHGNIKASRLTQPLTLQNSHGDVAVEDVVEATIEVAHGDTTASTVHALLEVESSHGGVEIRDVTGNVDVKTAHDDITLTNVSGVVSARNSHGDIKGTQLHGDHLEVSSSFGSIEVTTLAASIKCRNQHGDVKITSLNPELHEISARTSFDSLTLTLPADCEPHLTTSATFGEVDSEFAATGSAGPVVELKVEHGDIRIRKQQTAEQE